MINKVDGNHYNTYTKQKKVEVSDTGEKFNLGYQKKESSSGAQDKTEVSGKEKQQALEQGGVRLELSVGGQAAEADRRKQAEAAKAQGGNASAQLPLLETIRNYILAAVTAIREFFHTIWNDRPPEAVSQELQPLEGQLPEGDLQEAQVLDGVSQEEQLMESVLQDGQQTDDMTQEEQSAESRLQDGWMAGNVLQEELLVEGDPQEARLFGSNLRDMRSEKGALREPDEILDTSDETSVHALEEERRNREIRQSLRDGDMEHVIRLLTDNGRKTIAKNSTLLTSYDKNGRVVEPNASDRERALYGDKNTWTL